MSRPSISTPIFQSNLTDLLARLEGDTSARALELRREVEELRGVFESWHLGQPGDADRLSAIHRLFEIFRATMDYLTTKPDRGPA